MKDMPSIHNRPGFGESRGVRASPSMPLERVMQVLDPDPRLVRVKELIDRRYVEPLDVETLAQAAGLSRAHFSREFHRAFGDPPHQYLRARRLDRAATLLRITDRTAGEICRTVGFRSVGSFTTSFRRRYGVSPIAYRDAFPAAVEAAGIPACVVRTRVASGMMTADAHDAEPGR